MSTDMTHEDGWAIQLAYHRELGTAPPIAIAPEDETLLRELLGDVVIDAIRAEYGQGS